MPINKCGSNTSAEFKGNYNDIQRKQNNCITKTIGTINSVIYIHLLIFFCLIKHPSLQVVVVMAALFSAQTLLTVML